MVACSFWLGAKSLLTFLLGRENQNGMDETLRLVFVLLPKRIFLQVGSDSMGRKNESKHKRRPN